MKRINEIVRGGVVICYQFPYANRNKFCAFRDKGVVDANGNFTANDGNNKCSFYVEEAGVEHYVYFIVKPRHAFNLKMQAFKFNPKM